MKMMKKFIGVQLAIFFITASFLYLYASSIFGASTVEPKPIIFMTPEKSYEIWDAVNAFEDLWVPAGLTDTAAMKQKRAAIVKKLIALVRPYEELEEVVKQLFEAYIKHDLKKFLAHRTKIAEILAPVWQEAMIEAKEKEKERAQMGWFVRMRENITQAMNNLYNYLFPAKKEIKPVPQTTGKGVAGVQQR